MFNTRDEKLETFHYKSEILNLTEDEAINYLGEYAYYLQNLLYRELLKTNGLYITDENGNINLVKINIIEKTR